MTVEAELARVVNELRWADLPGRVRERVKVVLIDAVASAVVGRSADRSGQVEATLRALDGPGDSSVFGGSRLSLLGAVAQNAFQINSYTMCDVYHPALCHVAPRARERPGPPRG